MTNDLAHDLRNERPGDDRRERVEDLTRIVDLWTKADLSDPAVAARAADYFNQVRAERQRIEFDRKNEKAKHLASGRAVDRAAELLAAPLEPAWEIINEKVTALLLAKKAAGEPATLRGNYSSRAIALKSLWRATIEDQVQLYVYYADHPDVIATLQRLANAEAPAAHREKRQIPGCKLTEKEIAA